MAATKKDPKGVEIEVQALDSCIAEFCIVGTTPIILNRMSEKGVHELLFPAGRKNAAERASRLKHDPRAEFRAAPYRVAVGPTHLVHLATAFKGSLCGAALDMPGASKAQIGRLVQVVGEYVPIYGTPKLCMHIVRSADMNHTPDVRTRCIVPEWASFIRVSFVRPLVNEKAVANLLAAAGIIQGIGDFRAGKGKGTFGSYRLASRDDADYRQIVAESSHPGQVAAMEAAEPYDTETGELLAWFDEELIRRGRAPTKDEIAEKVGPMDLPEDEAEDE